MKLLTLILLSLFTSAVAFSQDNSNIKTIISDGIKLHDAGKHQEAIAKYNEALALDPNDPNANYEIAFTLFSTGKGKDAIPYLNKVVSGKSNVVAGAYDMLGSIYDDQKEPEKAIEYFNLGIKANPNYQRIYYNLAITYSRNGNDKEGMNAIIKALQLDPGHASSHRIYAMITMKNPETAINSLLAFSNFLILEPGTERSVVAYKDLQALLNAGITKEKGSQNITVSNSADADQNAANMAISLSSVAAAIPGITATELLEQQLKTIFSIAGEISAKKKEKEFFWSYYADFFGKLSKSDHMPFFTRWVSYSGNREENEKWIKEHQPQLKEFSDWLKANPRTKN
jgi:tetratricopeptide (TPR) repeat protein